MLAVLKTLEHWSYFKRTATKCTKVHYICDDKRDLLLFSNEAFDGKLFSCSYRCILC